MEEKIKCPFCNFETPMPTYGKVLECLGECYSTYSLFKDTDDAMRIKMRLVEIFFLDEQFNARITPDEIDEKCEFKEMPAGEGEKIVFAREKRIDEEEIEKLKFAESEMEMEIGADTLERLHYSLERFERSLRAGEISREKLLNEIKVVEKIVQVIREKIELSL
ncbi:MAG TPA: hypothetical protein PLQ76_02675 [bacterium]|nr:hypothetical protein [bacterium]